MPIYSKGIPCPPVLLALKVWGLLGPTKYVDPPDALPVFLWWPLHPKKKIVLIPASANMYDIHNQLNFLKQPTSLSLRPGGEILFFTHAISWPGHHFYSLHWFGKDYHTYETFYQIHKKP